DWAGLVQYLYELYPEHAKAETLAEGPPALDKIVDGYYPMWLAAEGNMLPDPLAIAGMPFQTNVFATATSLTPDEFIAKISEEAERLRLGVLDSADVTPALLNLAADRETWISMYIRSMEESGVLRPEDVPPEIREHPQIVSQMSILAGGILSGPAGEEYLRMQDFAEFFDMVRELYGYGEVLETEIGGYTPFAWTEAYGKDETHLAEIAYRLGNLNPVPVMPRFESYDLGLTYPTHFQAFELYVPWVGFEDRDALEPGWEEQAIFWLKDDGEFQEADFSEYLRMRAEQTGLVQLAGPATAETNGFVPVSTALPYSIHFENAQSSATYVSEVRIVTELDDAVDPVLFRLGDMQIGDIAIDVPTNLGMFQREYDFVATRGFLLRVSAGVDLASGTATWLFQAIDPETRTLLQDPSRGLLPPNNARGDGAGFVSYTVQARPDVITGTEILSQARVFFNNAAPEETTVHSVPVDAVAPKTVFSVKPLEAAAGEENPDKVFYEVNWSASDDAIGSGFHHVTLYVSTDGGIYRIWQRQQSSSAGTAVFEGDVGHDYEFLVLATDNAGNREKPNFLTSGDDDFHPDLGATPSVASATTDNYGIAPDPLPVAATNQLFQQARAGQQAPAVPPAVASEFDVVYEPFTAQVFASGFAQSVAGQIGPMAIVEDPRPGHEGEVLISGGAGRNEIWRFGFQGGTTQHVGEAEHWVLDYPIFNLAFDLDGNLWATTGGGPLLHLNPDTGQVLGAYGLLGEHTEDHQSGGITMGLAVNPNSGEIYVGSGGGVEIFHPEAIGDPSGVLFERYSADENLRVGSLAFYQFEDEDGLRSVPELWATTWPDRSLVVRFNGFKRAETVYRFDTQIDSITFGQSGTALQNLLFVSHNNGPEAKNAEERAWNGTSQLTMIDVVTRQQTALAKGGTRGDVVQTTRAGRVLLSQSNQVDVISPAIVPVVSFVNPPNQAIVALPMPSIAITFDQWMYTGSASEARSVLNPANYTLVGQSYGQVAIASVLYDASTSSVYLATGGMTEPDQWTLTLSAGIESLLGIALQTDYVTTFRTISDFTSLVEIDFANTRLDHAGRTLTFDVTVTNAATYDFELPLYLVLDPAPGSSVTPRGAVGPFTDGRYMIDLGSQLADGATLHAGEATNPLAVTIDVLNFDRADFSFSFFATPTVNLAPVFDADPQLTATVGTLYQSTVQAHDPDGTALTFFLADGPVGMTLQPQTGLLQWQPDATADDAVNVTIYVFDDRGARASLTRTITVQGGNHAPQLTPIGNKLVRREGALIELPIQATDADGDPLVYWAEGLPGGAEFDFDSHAFRWQVGALQTGVYPNVAFDVSDGLRETVMTTEFVILASDQPPVLNKPANRIVHEGDVVRFYLDGYDPDGDAVVFRGSSLPAGASPSG
ncbi:MAG TPA: putative Ig domain-containing protein, partial [Candidatus Anammoximicrobium sp.]|nr:putative Ig domain-containing protein [Candidatus Anammoximicrobium sp.]